MGTRVRLWLTLSAVAAAVGVGAAIALADDTVSIGTPTATPNGKASVAVTVSGPGRLFLGDAIHLRPCGAAPRIRTVDVTVGAAGTVVLPIRPLAPIQDDLKQGRRVKIPLVAQFWRDGVPGNQVEAFGRVVLHRKSAAKTARATAAAEEHRC